MLDSEIPSSDNALAKATSASCAQFLKLYAHFTERWIKFNKVLPCAIKPFSRFGIVQFDPDSSRYNLHHLMI